ncbi:AraC family transcriptional regulator [Paenibacillus sp. CC-CFT747]|nr:AraC family transcriptional regulator [Paenibacillus sp. CC-CFT747]
MVFMNIPYVLDDRMEASDFRFKSIWEVQANDAYQVVNPNGFEFPGIFVTYEGTGTVAVEDRGYSLCTGTYMIVPAGVPCSYRCIGGNWKFYFIHFDPLALVMELELPVGVPSATAQLSDAARLCKRMIDSLIVQPRGCGITVRLHAQELLLLFARERDDNNRNRYPELDDILFWMHQNITQSPPIDVLVRQSGMSRSVFFARFRARTGMSPNRYMQGLKLDSAKAALETTRLSVKEIAAALHFYDEFHFSKLFKQRYGVSPRTYRRNLLY